jgi:hypothetical protein
MDAELDGARQQAGHGHRAPPGRGHGGSGRVPVALPTGLMADGYARGRRYVLGELLGKTTKPWPADTVHGGLLTGWDRAWPTCAGQARSWLKRP